MLTGPVQQKTQDQFEKGTGQRQCSYLEHGSWFSRGLLSWLGGTLLRDDHLLLLHNNGVSAANCKGVVTFSKNFEIDSLS